ncbi:hypothetical protein ARMGADRAFT_929898, partial [Armillaria gallica]
MAHDSDSTVDEAHPHEITLEDAILGGPDLTPIAQVDEPLHESIRSSYNDDPFFKLILADPLANRLFEVKDDLVWMTNTQGVRVLCIPKGDHEGRSMHEIMLDQARKVLGHFGYQRTSEYVRRWYWW